MLTLWHKTHFARTATVQKTRTTVLKHSIKSNVYDVTMAALTHLCGKVVFLHGGFPIREDEPGRKHISGTTWDVYLFILTSNEPIGVRDVWRKLKLSSPSLAQYHINKLLDLKLLLQTQDGKYSVKEKEQIEALRSFVLLRGRLIPRLVFYGALIAGVLAVYLVFKPFRWDFRDLIFVIVSAFSILAFFFEAYNQYRSLRVSVQKI